LWYESAVPLSAELTAILVCPQSKQPLVYFPHGEAGSRDADGFLLCPASRLRYRIDAEGVPVLLVEEATELPPADVTRLVALARERGLAVP
jgi:uncharacterized protein YbaR (Trm112 family)